MITIQPEFLPHGGKMRLLASVSDYTDTGIVAISLPLHPDNPLAQNGQISCLNIIEYAAQTAAVHIGLLVDALAETAPEAIGVLASIRNVELMCDQLPLNVSLIITASCRARSSQGCSYTFRVTDGDRDLGYGDLVIAFQIAAHSKDAV